MKGSNFLQNDVRYQVYVEDAVQLGPCGATILQYLHLRLLITIFVFGKGDLLKVHDDHLREVLEKLVCVQTRQQLPEPLHPSAHRQLAHL